MFDSLQFLTASRPIFHSPCLSVIWACPLARQPAGRLEVGPLRGSVLDTRRPLVVDASPFAPHYLRQCALRAPHALPPLAEKARAQGRLFLGVGMSTVPPLHSQGPLAATYSLPILSWLAMIKIAHPQCSQ